MLALTACRPATSPLKVTFLDVGQGDAAFIQTPSGKTILIDAGGVPEGVEGASDPGDRVVVPFLRRSGVARLDLLVLTHAHRDHFGGAAAVLRSIKASLILIGGESARDEDSEYQALVQAAEQSGLPIRRGQAGQQIDCGDGVKFTVLGPPKKAIVGSGADTNNASVVLRLDYGQGSFLFAGDAEDAAEQAILESEAMLAAEVLKVGHHGSRSSTSAKWLDAVHPKLAIISCGRENRFGHPHPETLRNLAARGVRTLVTSQDGAVTVLCDRHGCQAQAVRQDDSIDLR